MKLLTTTVRAPQDDVITEGEFGLHIYSIVGKDKMKDLLDIQQKYVDEGTLLFFLRELNEGDGSAGAFYFQTYRVMKDDASLNRIEAEITDFYESIWAIDSSIGSFEQEKSELTYEEFVELQSRSGSKYYFAGLADVLDDYD